MEYFEPELICSMPGRADSEDSLDVATAEFQLRFTSPLTSTPAVAAAAAVELAGPAERHDAADISRTLEWFRQALERASKEGYITVRELEKAATKEHKV